MSSNLQILLFGWMNIFFILIELKPFSVSLSVSLYFFFSRNQKKIQFAICDQGLNFLKKSESFLALW